MAACGNWIPPVCKSCFGPPVSRRTGWRFPDPMRIHQRFRKTNGLTFVEVIVIIAVMVVLVGLLLPALSRAKARSKGISCVNCLKQVGLAARIFATDNDGKFPWQVSTNATGSREYLEARSS